MFNARMNQAIDHGCKWNDGGECGTSRGIIFCCNLLFRASENTIYQRPY